MGFKIKPISDQIGLVTGGGTGIGRAFSEALAKAGVRVVIAARREEVLRYTAEELNLICSEERVFTYACDIRDHSQIRSLINHVVGRWQSIDLLINNSGLAVPEAVDQITEDGWDKVMETNLRGVMQLVRAVLPHMIKNDFGDGVNIRVFNFCPGLVDVDNSVLDAEPRAGFIHASNMARTLMYVLGLDRNVVLEDINLYSR